MQTREGPLAGELVDLADIHQTRLDGVERDKRSASTHRRGTGADMEEAMQVGYFAVGIGPNS
jgi:hypothetical protein